MKTQAKPGCQPGFSISPYVSTNFEIQKYYQNESRFNGKIQDGIYVIRLDGYKSIETRLIALESNENVTYFDNFGVENVLKEI